MHLKSVDDLLPYVDRKDWQMDCMPTEQEQLEHIFNGMDMDIVTDMEDMSLAALKKKIQPFTLEDDEEFTAEEEKEKEGNLNEIEEEEVSMDILDTPSLHVMTENVQVSSRNALPVCPRKRQHDASGDSQRTDSSQPDSNIIPEISLLEQLRADFAKLPPAKKKTSNFKSHPEKVLKLIIPRYFVFVS